MSRAQKIQMTVHTDIMSRDSKASERQKIILFAAVAAGTIGVLFYNLMPLYLGTLQDSTGLSYSQIGLVASALFLGFNLVSASSYFWVRKYSFRVTAVISVSILSVFLFLNALATNFLPLIVMVVIIGGASGALSSVSNTIISDTENVTYWYGVKVAVESAAGVILLFLLPVTLVPLYGFKGTLAGMLLVTILFALLLRYLPEHSQKSEVGKTDSRNVESTEWRSVLPACLALAAIFFIDIGGAAVWAFEERIGNQYGFDMVWVGTVLGGSLVFAVIGPMISAGLGNRFGNRVPFTLAASLMIIGIFAIVSSQQSAFYYAFGACFFMLGWGSAVPFMFAQVAATDPNGRYITLTNPAMGIGSMLGPVFAGFLFSDKSLTPVQFLAILAISMSIVFIWMSGKD